MNPINDPRRAKFTEIFLSNPGMSAEQAMILAGYSETYAHNSSALTKSKSFLEKVDEGIGDDKIVATIRSLMNRRTISLQEHPIDTPDEEIIDDVEKQGGEFPKIKVVIKTRSIKNKYTDEEDGPAYSDESYEVKEVKFYLADGIRVDAMLDKLFKLRGDYAPEKVDHTILSPFIKLIQKQDNEKNSPTITEGHFLD